MSVDPLHVAQRVEVHRARFNAFDATGADACKVRLGGARFEIAPSALAFIYLQFC
jgi:hypothetical protein